MRDGAPRAQPAIAILGTNWCVRANSTKPISNRRIEQLREVERKRQARLQRRHQDQRARAKNELRAQRSAVSRALASLGASRLCLLLSVAASGPYVG